MTDRRRLNEAYAYVSAGDPMKALSVVLDILRGQFGGDERRVFAFIQEAKASFAQSQRTDEQIEYMKLIEELQAMSLSQEKDQSTMAAQEQASAEALLQRLIAKESILGQSGREQIMIDAHGDGSSVVCDLCHELIAVKRWDQHVKFWCPARPHSSENGDDDDDDDDDMA